MTDSTGSVELPNTATCLGCGYQLRGLPESRCPECSRPFDPADATTFSADFDRMAEPKCHHCRGSGEVYSVTAKTVVGIAGCGFIAFGLLAMASTVDVDAIPFGLSLSGLLFVAALCATRNCKACGGSGLASDRQVTG